MNFLHSERKRRLARVGHRGAAAYAPHNTTRSFQLALDQGVDMIETDVRLCASGEIVLSHDPDLHAANGQGLSLRRSRLADLREMDLGDGERVLTFDEFLQLCRGRCAVMPDLKEEGFEVELIDAIHRAGFDACDLVIPGGSQASRSRLRDLAPDIPLSLTLDRVPAGGLSGSFLDAIDTPVVTWHHSLLDAGTILQLHEREKSVYAWTVDRIDEMERLIRDGVDGIITNRPGDLNRVLSRL